MSWLLEQIGAAYELLRLWYFMGFRRTGAYAEWRMHTAFGRGLPEGGRWGLAKATWHYGRWVYRMRRGR